MAFSLQARVVFPVDRPPIENGVVTIDGERIVAIGTKANGGDVIDLGDVALLPGLVNAHTHLEFSYLQQSLGQPGMSLVDWIRLVIAERGRGNRVEIESLRQGTLESIHGGATSIGDIATSVPGFLPITDVTVFREVIGFSRSRADSALNNLIERLDFVEQAVAKFEQSERTLTHFGISPHAPYTVSPDLLTRMVELACDRGFPMAMHIAESREELELLRSGSGPFCELLEERSMWDADAIPDGSRPMDYLQMLSKAPRALVIHGNYLDLDELSFVGASQNRMSLVYCPRTHAYFFHPPYPLEQALAAGVRVALGTDSRASNPDLDLLAEMRHVAHAHPTVPPHDVLRMGTLAGAEALGRDQDVGSITPGKLANLVAIPVSANRNDTADDMLSVVCTVESKPSAVYLAGRRL